MEGDWLAAHFASQLWSISIHALRVEGDGCRRSKTDKSSYFYPRPPGGGRPQQDTDAIGIYLFLSTPSGWRATLPQSPRSSTRSISIQACSQLPVFLSTPSGWRATRRRNNIILDGSKFLSTPSGWRATARSLYHAARRVGFLSTPSGWRATTQLYGQGRKQAISIHALRVEGDYAGGAQWAVPDDFYPRPPGGGRRGTDKAKARLVKISIHALRVEGDALHLPGIFKEVYFYPRPPGGGRPWKRYRRTSWKPYFYPRPPGGGRLLTMRSKKSFKYFYPRPPGGGRQARGRCKTDTNDFYPRPPGGGRHSGGGFARNRRVFLSTPSGWRATCAAIAMIRASHAISIHALRVEGDACTINAKCPGDDISIHALRVEGDVNPPAWGHASGISIHALRVEGDRWCI